MAAPLPSTPVTDEEALAVLKPLRDGAGAVLAVSGGPDSLALMLLVAAQIRREPDGWPPVIVGSVDHGLRPEAAGEARAVIERARERGLPGEVLTINETAPVRGIGPWAREWRYRLLADLAARHGLQRIVTAHHLDDQAETLLMRMASGSGLTGLAGMKRASTLCGCEILRPLLDMPKSRLVATCAAHGLVPADDESNRDPRHERARWRALMPALAREGLTAERLGLMAQRLARADAVLASLAQDIASQAVARDGTLAMPLAQLAGIAPELRLRVLRILIDRAGGYEEGGVTPAGPRLERVEALVERLGHALACGAPFHATIGGVALRIRRDRLVLSPEKPRRTPSRQMF
jgi:tRNA(Ile)-lysidine synthase